MHECVSPDIVQFYGSFLSDAEDGVNIVMEYMNGHCLETMMGRIGRLDEVQLGCMYVAVLHAPPLFFGSIYSTKCDCSYPHL